MTNNNEESEFSIYSINDFREWLNKQTKSNELPAPVKPRIGIERLEEKLELHNPELKNISSLAKEFKEYGGMAVSKKEKEFVVEVSFGKFLLPETYTKFKK